MDTIKKKLLRQKYNPLTLTRPECKYKLWGIITAPTIPTACRSAELSQSLHHGKNIPLISCPPSGFTITNYKIETQIYFYYHTLKIKCLKTEGD